MEITLFINRVPLPKLTNQNWHSILAHNEYINNLINLMKNHRFTILYFFRRMQKRSRWTKRKKTGKLCVGWLGIIFFFFNLLLYYSFPFAFVCARDHTSSISLAISLCFFVGWFRDNLVSVTLSISCLASASKNEESSCDGECCIVYRLLFPSSFVAVVFRRFVSSACRLCVSKNILIPST